MNSTGERSASESVAQREEIAQAVIEHPHMRVDGLAEHGRETSARIESCRCGQHVACQGSSFLASLHTR